MADSDNEVEEFAVTDYDLQNEFFPGMKRRKMTKEQAMLGIWASRDSDDDDVGEKKRKANYSMPMQFISGGIVKTKDKESLGEFHFRLLQANHIKHSLQFCIFNFPYHHSINRNTHYTANILREIVNLL